MKSQVGNLLFSGVLGWWGFPWGLLFTPVQVGRNLIAIFTPPDPSQPSAKLLQVARVQIASKARRKARGCFKLGEGLCRR